MEMSTLEIWLKFNIIQTRTVKPQLTIDVLHVHLVIPFCQFFPVASHLLLAVAAHVL